MQYPKQVKVIIEVEEILLLQDDEDAAALEAELTGNLPYIVEFETIAGDIIMSSQIIAKI